MAASPQNGNGNGSNLLQKWAPIALACIALVSAAASYFGQQGQNTSALDGLKATVQAQTERLNRMQQQQGEMNLAETEACRQLATVEVQLGTVETIINKTQVSNQRDIALLWNKVYAQEYPNVFYAVNIPHEAMPCAH